MKVGAIESHCQYASGAGYHVWAAYRHSRDWTVQAATCMRCGERSTGAAERYVAVAKKIDEYWSGYSAAQMMLFPHQHDKA